MNAASQTTQILDILPETPDTQTFRFKTYFLTKRGRRWVCDPGDPKNAIILCHRLHGKDYVAITIKADKDNPALYGSLFTLKKESAVELTGPWDLSHYQNPFGARSILSPPQWRYAVSGYDPLHSGRSTRYGSLVDQQRKVAGRSDF